MGNSGVLKTINNDSTDGLNAIAHILPRTVTAQAGDKIVLQNSEGNYFYIIKKGRARVTRTIPNQPKAIKLAELKEGDSFGEEALISKAKRNASVTMVRCEIARRTQSQFNY